MTTQARDWAQQIIDEMAAKHIGDDQATQQFQACYADGDSVEAWEAYRSEASRVIDMGAGYNVLVFADGSAYYDAKQGIDRFYPIADEIADGLSDQLRGIFVAQLHG